MNHTLRQAAAIVLWRQGAAGALEVFLAKRAETLAAFGGFWAFLGGSVDAHDSALDIDGTQAPVAVVAAAARELFEEAGVLAHTGEKAAGCNDADWRAAVLADAGVFALGLAQRGLKLDGPAFVPFGQWQTPPFSPMRFACQYFALRLPEGQSPTLWPGELSAGCWMTPSDALAAHDAGDMLLAYPVLATLRALDAADGHVECACLAAQSAPDSLSRRSNTLVPGVRMLPVKSPTLPPATHTNCYILGDSELIIVDPGTPYAADQADLLDYIDSLVGRGARVQEVWLTHAHPDHTGCAALAQKRFRVPIAAHKDCAQALRAGGDCRVDRLIDDNAQTHLAGDFHWQALYTPGHAPGHLCFYETRRQHLLSGDNVLGQGYSMVAPKPHGSMRHYMSSLRRLLHLDAGILLPGHGPPVATPQATLKRYIAHREAREAKVLFALGARPQNSDRLLAAVYNDIDPRARPMAQISLAAHLEKLIDEKQAAAIDGGYVRC